MLLTAALVTPVTRADAASTLLCNGYASCASSGYADGGYQAKQGTSYWAMYTGTNCTNYVAYRLVTTNKMANRRPAPGVGNARDWGTTMASITNSTPAAGSVAWWGRASGGNHVAYVERVVSASEIWVSESNWAGAFDWRKITRTGSGWPDGFIHFADTVEQKMTLETAPTFSSIPTAGVELRVGTGTWSPASSTFSYTYQWYLDGQAISGARSSRFTPTTAMLGRDLSVAVTASRPGFTSRTTTVQGEDVWPTALQRQRTPKIYGTPRVGRPLTVNEGVWFPQPDEYTYQWTADGTTIPGATRRSFTPTAGHRDKQIRAVVTVRHPDYDPVVVTSAPVGPVSS